MAEVKRYSGKTYARSEESASSKAFDDAFSKSKPTNMKWGNASYSKTRNENAPSSKKPKLEEEEPSDPFSFEFDSDRSPKKKALPKPAPANMPRTVVMQPAVRIAGAKKVETWPKSELDENDDVSHAEDSFATRKEAVRTYSKRTIRTIKKEVEEEDTQTKMDRYMSTRRGKPTPAAKEDSPPSTTAKNVFKPTTSQDAKNKAKESPDFVDMLDMDTDDDLYIEPDDGASYDIKDPNLFKQPVEEDNIFTRPKHQPRSMTNAEGEEVTVRFRSRYLNPEVYKKFTENITPKDPVGSLSNSKVVHKNVLKHDSGTTLIVVCSPKVDDSQIKQSHTQAKYFKDNAKDLVKSRRKTVESIAKGGRKKKSPTPEVDPFAIEDDPPPAPAEPQTEPESPIVVSSATEETPATSQATVETVEERSETPEPQQVAAIVKSAKAAPPKKYHRIFRSRNKGYMEPQPETPPPSQDSPEPAPPTLDTPTQGEKSTDNGVETPAVGVGTDHDMDTPDTQGSMSMKLPISMVIEETGQSESDIDNSQASQQSNTSDSQPLDSSQETSPSKRPKSVRAVPAERKIFRARGSKNAAPKKIFSSPKKAAAVYNVRSWQDEEESSVPQTSYSAMSIDPAPRITPITAAPKKIEPPPPKLKPVIKKTVAPAKPVPPEMPRLTRAVHWEGRHGDDAYTSVHVNKEHKELFTIVKNVKEAHECQEFGEVQEFDDDIDYLLAGIESLEPMSTRCLSCIGLAQKSTIPAFRMHLRAHGTVTKIFGCLQDAASDPSLALCTSALMFMLSRDRLNMDLDQEALNLMLRLLGVDQQEDLATTLSPTATRALKRNKDRVHEVYMEFLQQSGAKQDTVDIDTLSTGNLAMETLLSLTSRRAGEWFKEELRSLGALDHIVDTVCSCIEAVGMDVRVLTTSNVENLKKVDRCLRVLENVTYLNADNQKYLMSFKESCLVSSLSKALKMCNGCLGVYPLSESLATGKVDKESCGWVIYSCILAILRVLLNLTHDNETGCANIGDQGDVLETVTLCILQSPQYVPIDLRFDLFVLSLGLLINLVEHSDQNRTALLTMETVPNYENPIQSKVMLAYLSLVEVFSHREDSAKQLEEADEPKTPEASPNKSGEWRESDSGMEWVIDSAKKDKSASKSYPRSSSNGGIDVDKGKDLEDEETFTKALHKAGKHMENSIVAAYVALLVGCLIQDNKECADSVKNHLNDKTFDGMIYMLKKFLGFMNLTSGTGSAGGKSIERVIDVLEKC